MSGKFLQCCQYSNHPHHKGSPPCTHHNIVILRVVSLAGVLARTPCMAKLFNGNSSLMKFFIEMVRSHWSKKSDMIAHFSESAKRFPQNLYLPQHLLDKTIEWM